MAVLFCCFGETFSHMWVQLHGTPYCPSSSCLPTLLLPPAPLLEATWKRPVAFTCVDFPLAAPDSQHHSVSPKGITRCSLGLRAMRTVLVRLCLGLPHVLQKCKQRCGNTARGDGQDFMSVTNPDKGRKYCSFPHKAGSRRRMGFLTIHTQGVTSWCLRVYSEEAHHPLWVKSHLLRAVTILQPMLPDTEKLPSNFLSARAKGKRLCD